MQREELQTQIDKIDEQMLALFRERIEAAKRLALCKQEEGLPVQDPARERKILARMSEQAGEELSTYAYALYSDILDMSKASQEKVLHPTSPLREPD